MVSSETLPFVRVILLDFNGGSTVVDAVDAVTKTQWPADRLEIVCVDNGSTDGSLEEIERRFPFVVTMRNGENLGFPGNNVAMRDLDGVDYVALVNSDAFVEPSWLMHLVSAGEADPGLGAVCPKILFAGGFVEEMVHIRQFAGQVAHPVVLRGLHVNGEDVFARVHVAGGGGRSSDRDGILEWLCDGARIRIPSEWNEFDSSELDAVFTFEALSHCQITVGPNEGGASTLSPGERVDLRVSVTNARIEVLNNIGSWIDGSWKCHERGLFEVDRGQFDEPVEVGAWCGAAVLLRSSFLKDAGLFEDSFFLYFEDTDLSVRGRWRNWRYATEPRSVVRHLHSASTIEGSAFADFYIQRNWLLLVHRHAGATETFKALRGHFLVSGSYLKSSLARTRQRGSGLDLTTVGIRISAFAGYLRLVPSTVLARRKLVNRRLISRDELELGLGQPISGDPSG